MIVLPLIGLTALVALVEPSPRFGRAAYFTGGALILLGALSSVWPA